MSFHQGSSAETIEPTTGKRNKIIPASDAVSLWQRRLCFHQTHRLTPAMDHVRSLTEPCELVPEGSLADFPHGEGNYPKEYSKKRQVLFLVLASKTRSSMQGTGPGEERHSGSDQNRVRLILSLVLSTTTSCRSIE